MKTNGHHRKTVTLKRPKVGAKGNLLLVAYPLLPVTRESAGGAEQMLHSIEQRAAARGWQTTVAACSGSSIAGGLYSTGAPAHGALRSVDGFLEDHCREVRELIQVRAGIGRAFDLVHDHSGSFFGNAARADAPILATLHLPRTMYPHQLFQNLPANLHFNCVSDSQAATFSDLPGLLGVVRNGISLKDFPFRARKKDYLLWLGRICEEKAPHIALDIAQRLQQPIVLAGQVYPLAYHQNYFEREIAPRLNSMRHLARLVTSPSQEEKAVLLAEARAVLIPSQVEEASSLVAMEAAACGTPVICSRRG